MQHAAPPVRIPAEEARVPIVLVVPRRIALGRRRRVVVEGRPAVVVEDLVVAEGAVSSSSYFIAGMRLTPAQDAAGEVCVCFTVFLLILTILSQDAAVK